MQQGRLAQMEADSAMLRVELDKERQGRVAAERQAQSITQALASAHIAIQAGQARRRRRAGGMAALEQVRERTAPFRPPPSA